MRKIIVLSVAFAVLVTGSAQAQIGLGIRGLQDWLVGPPTSHEDTRRLLSDPACQKELADWEVTQKERRKRWRDWDSDPMYAHPEGKQESRLEKYRRVVHSLSPCRRAKVWYDTRREFTNLRPKMSGGQMTCKEYAEKLRRGEEVGPVINMCGSEYGGASISLPTFVTPGR